MFHPKRLIRAVLAKNGLLLRDEIEKRIMERDAALRQEMENRDAVWRGKIQNLNSELLRILLGTRQAIALTLWASGSSDPGPPRPPVASESFEEYLAKLQSVHPRLFETWASMNFTVNLDEYRQRPESSCSTSAHKVAPLFGGFIAPYLRGRVLDIGCGPYSVPSYLVGYPVELLSGIDPLVPFEPHPFEFVRGFAEFLPWGASTFDVLVAATSLDHVLSLDRAFSEMVRVLKPGGMFLVWEGFVKGAPPYDPDSAEFQPSDRLHLFHFDEEWFEKLVEHHFHIREKLTVDGASYFYCLAAPK